MTPRGIVVLADDLSGAAETAAAFLDREPGVVLELDAAQPISDPVTVVDVNTRAMAEPDAVAVLRRTLHAVTPGRLVLLKIDSLLRGHVGSAVDVLAARGPVVVAAGLPALDRHVRGGVPYVDGSPLRHTDAWQLEDVAPPDDVRALFTHPAVVCAEPRLIGEALAAGAVAVCDVVVDADLDAIVAAATDVPDVQLVGTAALAAAVARTLPPAATRPAEEGRTAAVLIVVGTAASTATAQLAVLARRGVRCVGVDADLLLDGVADAAGVAAALAGRCDVAVSVTGAVRPGRQRELAAALGRFVADVHRHLAAAPDLVLTGGETARAVIDALGIRTLRPVDVVHHGAVVGVDGRGRRIVTRPGSFGDEASLADITARLTGRRSSATRPTDPRSAPSSTRRTPA